MSEKTNDKEISQAEKDAIKDMVDNCNGWKVFVKWCNMDIAGSMSLLINENDDKLRGRIQVVNALLSKVNRNATNNKK